MTYSFREILESHTVANLKKEISKTNIKGYSKKTRLEVIELMLEYEHYFKHMKMYVPKERKKPTKKTKKTEKKPHPPKHPHPYTNKKYSKTGKLIKYKPHPPTYPKKTIDKEFILESLVKQQPPPRPPKPEIKKTTIKEERIKHFMFYFEKMLKLRKSKRNAELQNIFMKNIIKAVDPRLESDNDGFVKMHKMKYPKFMIDFNNKYPSYLYYLNNLNYETNMKNDMNTILYDVMHTEDGVEREYKWFDLNLYYPLRRLTDDFVDDTELPKTKKEYLENIEDQDDDIKSIFDIIFEKNDNKITTKQPPPRPPKPEIKKTTKKKQPPPRPPKPEIKKTTTKRKQELFYPLSKKNEEALESIKDGLSKNELRSPIQFKRFELKQPNYVKGISDQIDDISAKGEYEFSYDADGNKTSMYKVYPAISHGDYSKRYMGYLVEKKKEVDWFKKWIKKKCNEHDKKYGRCLLDGIDMLGMVYPKMRKYVDSNGFNGSILLDYGASILFINHINMYVNPSEIKHRKLDYDYRPIGSLFFDEGMRLRSGFSNDDKKYIEHKYLLRKILDMSMEAYEEFRATRHDDYVLFVNEYRADESRSYKIIYRDTDKPYYEKPFGAVLNHLKKLQNELNKPEYKNDKRFDRQRKEVREKLKGKLITPKKKEPEKEQEEEQINIETGDFKYKSQKAEIIKSTEQKPIQIKKGMSYNPKSTMADIINVKPKAPTRKAPTRQRDNNNIYDEKTVKWIYDNYSGLNTKRNRQEFKKMLDDKPYYKNLINAISGKSMLDFYPTPSHCLDSKYAKNAIDDANVILEPSAGTGAMIYKAYKDNPNVKIKAVELSLDLIPFLEYHYPNTNIVQGSFLDIDNYDNYKNVDTVLLNPPFTKGGDKRFYLDFLLKTGDILNNTKTGRMPNVIFLCPSNGLGTMKRNRDLEIDDIVDQMSMFNLISLKKLKEICKMLKIDTKGLTQKHYKEFKEEGEYSHEAFAELDNILPYQIKLIDKCKFKTTGARVDVYGIIYHRTDKPDEEPEPYEEPYEEPYKEPEPEPERKPPPRPERKPPPRPAKPEIKKITTKKKQPKNNIFLENYIDIMNMDDNIDDNDIKKINKTIAFIYNNNYEYLKSIDILDDIKDIDQQSKTTLGAKQIRNKIFLSYDKIIKNEHIINNPNKEYGIYDIQLIKKVYNDIYEKLKKINKEKELDIKRFIIMKSDYEYLIPSCINLIIHNTDISMTPKNIIYNNRMFYDTINPTETKLQANIIFYTNLLKVKKYIFDKNHITVLKTENELNKYKSQLKEQSLKLPKIKPLTKSGAEEVKVNMARNRFSFDLYVDMLLMDNPAHKENITKKFIDTAFKRYVEFFSRHSTISDAFFNFIRKNKAVRKRRLQFEYELELHKYSFKKFTEKEIDMIYSEIYNDVKRAYKNKKDIKGKTYEALRFFEKNNSPYKEYSDFINSYRYKMEQFAEMIKYMNMLESPSKYLKERTTIYDHIGELEDLYKDSIHDLDDFFDDRRRKQNEEYGKAEKKKEYAQAKKTKETQEEQRQRAFFEKMMEKQRKKDYCKHLLTKYNISSNRDFNKFALKYHPDKTIRLPKEEREEKSKIFAEVSDCVDKKFKGGMIEFTNKNNKMLNKLCSLSLKRIRQICRRMNISFSNKHTKEQLLRGILGI